MRPKLYCPKFQPWCGTSKGEIDEACVDNEKRTIKRCDGCIDKQNDYCHKEKSAAQEGRAD